VYTYRSAGGLLWSSRLPGDVSRSKLEDGDGVGGNQYGDTDLNFLYLGSGGGSGGNARDLTSNPIGTYIYNIYGTLHQVTRWFDVS